MASVIRATATLTVLALLAIAAPAAADVAKRPWPPRDGPGLLFVHYGEEHWNDPDGEVILRQVVADTIRYRPGLVTMSGDKVDDGTAEQLDGWRKIMDAYDRAGIPYMAAVGNHDGKQPTPESITDIAPGSTPLRDITFYKQVFAGRPYPMGDAPPYANPLMAPAARPPDDPQGASTHYWVDYGNVRHVFIDSSCYGIVNCEPLQNPPDGKGRDQFEFLRAAASEAKAQGQVVFVVTHMPTRDPRDPRHSTPVQINHVMGIKGVSTDNATLEQEAERLGVDAVLVAHIKGQWQYVGRGGIPYYIDGGAGGELYTSGPVGVDHGYWYGYRLLRVDGKRVETDVVPVIAAGGVVIEGPERLVSGRLARFEAFAKQPATKSHRGVVERLELRDPDPLPRPGSALDLAPLWPAIAWLAPLLAVVALALGRRRLVLALAVVVPGTLGIGAVAVAQRSEPTSTPKAALPNPARIFTSHNPRVLAPVASDSDDPRRDVRTQTADGRFRAVCPGRTTMSLTSGFEERRHAVTVPSRPGRIVRSIARRSGATLRRRASARLAAVRLAQRAVLRARIRRGGRTVATLDHRCAPRGAHSVTWRPRSRGRYTLEIAVFSDRPPVRRSYRLRVR